MKKHDIVLILVTLMVCLAMYLQALQPLWRWHLEMDVFAFFEKINGVSHPEYLPGASWFFRMVGFFTIPLTLANYYNVLFLINFALFGVLVLLYKKFGSFNNALLFLLVTLVSGPYLLFRFELLVAVILVLSLVFWQKRQFKFAYFLLGAATAVKLYPVVLLPYYFLLSKNIKNAFMGLILFLGALLLISGGTITGILNSLNNLSNKPIGVESIPATIITLKSLILSGLPPKIYLGNSVWGLTGDYNLNMFGWLWVIPVGCFYIYLMFKKDLNRVLDIGVVFILLLLFLIFSKNLNPQYLFWFISIFPLMKATSEEGGRDYVILFSIIIIISYLNQCIYPLLFSDFLGKFYSDGKNWEIFYLQLLKNISLIGLLILSIKYVFIKKTIS